MTQAELDALIQQRGGLASAPYVVDPKVSNPNPVDAKVNPQIDNPNPKKRYSFKDGTWIEIRTDPTGDPGTYQVTDGGTGLKPPTQSQTAPTSKTHEIFDDPSNPDSPSTTYTYKWNPNGIPPGGTAATGAYEIDTSIPPERKPGKAGSTANKPPSDPSKWVQIHADPNDPNSRVIALQDPQNSSNRVSVPADTKPDKPQLAQGPNGAFYSWDGSKLTQLQAGTPEKRQIVQGQGGRLLAWDGQNLTVLEAGSQPKNGDTMQDVDAKGYPVTKTYQNGQWGVTSTAAPTPPTEGKTRSNIENGYNVTQTFQGGEWTTTSVNGRAIPEKPTQLTTPADQPTISTIDSSGKIVTQQNPAFQPKTLADVAARRGQLQQTMAAKSAEVTANVGKIIDGKKYTSDDALRDYNKWHAQQIEPQISSLEAAQQAAQFAQAKDIATMRTSAQTAATAAGKNAIDAANAQRQMNPVGPGFAAALNEVAAKSKYLPKNFGDVVTYEAPNPIDLQKQASMEALKYIDSTAAAANGLPAPNLQAMRPEDLQAALGANRYAPRSLGEPAGPPQTLAADATTNQGGDLNTWFAGVQARQAQSTAEQRIQAQVPMGSAGAWTPPGGSSYMNAGPAPYVDTTPVTLQQQYGTPNPWDIYAPDYTYG